MIRSLLIAALAAWTPATPAAAQTPVATPFLPVPGEPAPRLIVDPPLAGPLARGAVIIQYRLEHARIVPIFGPAALDVTPRAAHLHVTVDNLPWHWADASDTRTIVVVGLPPGPHSVLIELADPAHRVFEGQSHRISFTVPASHGGH